jgi:hypothetical protein
MKELITVDVVKEMAAKNQGPIRLTSNTIITPAARDQAEELGIEMIQESIPSEAAGNKDRRRKIIGAVVQFLKEEFGDQPLDEETVRTVVTKVLERLG